jgi:4a-hydroxytetrahydrobiopterin dehydratase
MMRELKEEHCVPCRGDTPKLTDDEIQELLDTIPSWEVVTEEGVKRLRRTFKFGSYKFALDFVNQLGQMAQEEDHHPVICFDPKSVTVTWWTHAIGGLHRNDFIMAAKSENAYLLIKREIGA